MNSKVSLGNGNLPLADGIRHLYGNLYLVPFKAIHIVTETKGGNKETKYSFVNPRLLTEKGQKSFTNKESSLRLRTDIKRHGMMHPFVCVWFEKNGIMCPKLIGGHNRANAISKLISDNEQVKDISKDQPALMTLDSNKEISFSDEFSPASKVYEFVLCTIYAVDEELDSLELSYSENNCRENLTLGHDIAILKELLHVKASDERIIKILQKDEKWLRDVKSLLDNVDSQTLDDLIEDKISLDSAFELIKINDMEIRHNVRDSAINESMEDHQKKMERIKKEITTCLIEKDIQEGNVVTAKYHNDKSKLKEAEDAIEEIEQKSQRLSSKIQTMQPKATVKNIKKARISHNVSNIQKRGLKGKSIQIIYEYVNGLLEVAEANEDEAVVEKLKLCCKLTKAILDGDQDWKNIFKEFDNSDEDMPELEDEE